MTRVSVRRSVSTIAKAIGSVGSSGGGWTQIATPSGLAYALTTHRQEVYYDSSLGGIAFRPYGLFTDTAGTTLATTAGDLIARWDDTLTASGLSMRQATSANRPTLRFRKNSSNIYVPVVRFDGSNDQMSGAATVALWTAKRGGIYGRIRNNANSMTVNAIQYQGTSNFHVINSSYVFRWNDDGVELAAEDRIDNGAVRFAIVRTSDTNRAFYRNGTFKNNSAGNNSAAQTGTLRFGTAGFSLAPIDVECFCYSDSGTYSSAIDDFVAAITPNQIAFRTVVCDGNSMTFGQGSSLPTGAYPDQLQTSLGDTWQVKNFGVPGQTTADMITDAATQIDTAFTNATKKIVVCWEGTNDLFLGASAATAYANLVSYCTARRAAGLQVVICTILPRSGGSPPPSFETDRQTVNTNIRNNYTSYADALADVAADSRIGDAGDEADTTYYSDLTHMTSTGYGVVAGIVKTAVDSL